jgi:flagellar biosynthetic protein FliO
MKVTKAVKRYSKTFVGISAILVTLLLVVIWSSGVRGTSHQSPPDTTGRVDMANFGVGGTAIKVIGSVLLVLGILYAGVYAMKAFSGRAGSGRFKQDTIAVLHKRYIAPKKAVYVIRVGDRSMVLGVTDSQISHLADLTKEEIENLKATEGKKSKDFKKHFLGLALGMKERD